MNALRIFPRFLPPLLPLLVAACSDAPPSVGGATPGDMLPAQGGSAPTVPTVPAEPPVPAERPRAAHCVAPSGVSNAPATILEAVTLINALPKPLTLPCFIQSLARPLAVFASNSVFSLQPAQGSRSPRIFLLTPALVMSVVPAGSGAPFLEFGETRAEFRSLKGEIAFPVLAPLTPSAPFEHVMFNEQVTTCAVCHASETEESNVLGVRQFVSRALRPVVQDQVTAARLQQELAACDPNAEPERCALLDALFGFGTVTDLNFDLEISTF